MAKRLTATIDKEIKQLLINDFGYEPVDLESYTGQIRALKESYNSLQIKNPKDPRLIQLQIAVKDLKADREIEKDKTGKLKKTRKRRSDAKSLEQIQAEINARTKKKKISAASIAPTPNRLLGKGIGKSPIGESSQGIVDTINENVGKILGTLQSLKKLRMDEGKAERLDNEKEKREKKETSLEKSKFTVFKQVASKVLKPFQSIFSKVLDFIKTILLGRVLFKIIEWMGDKKNQKSIQNIFKFLKTFWPALLAAYLLFGNTFGKMLVKITASVAKFGIMIVKKLIPQLLAALAKLKAGKLAKFLGGKKGMMALSLLAATPALVNRFTDGGEEGDEDIQEFKQGGFVSGPAGPDQVPAKLTAGEFVMSKGAVQKYGANTLAAMNAAGGGTNIPTITNEYNDGGIVDKSRYYTKMGRPMVKTNTPNVNFNTGGFVGDSFKFKGGNIVKKNIVNKVNPVKNFNSGGLVTNVVQNFQGGGRVRGTGMKYDSRTTTPVINPPSSNNTVVQNYAIQKAAESKQYSGGSGSSVPNFDAEKYVSKQKIQTLGMTI